MTDRAVERSLGLMETAKGTLLTDKAVASMAFLFWDNQPPVPVLADYRDEKQKRHFLDEALPSPVRQEAADGVALVADAWVRGQDCIVVTAEQRDGRTAMWITPYVKKFPRRITLGETEGGLDEGENTMFQAVREVWASE